MYVCTGRYVTRILASCQNVVTRTIYLPVFESSGRNRMHSFPIPPQNISICMILAIAIYSSLQIVLMKWISGNCRAAVRSILIACTHKTLTFLLYLISSTSPKGSDIIVFNSLSFPISNVSCSNHIRMPTIFKLIGSVKESGENSVYVMAYHKVLNSVIGTTTARTHDLATIATELHPNHFAPKCDKETTLEKDAPKEECE